MRSTMEKKKLVLVCPFFDLTNLLARCQQGILRRRNSAPYPTTQEDNINLETKDPNLEAEIGPLLYAASHRGSVGSASPLSMQTHNRSSLTRSTRSPARQSAWILHPFAVASIRCP